MSRKITSEMLVPHYTLMCPELSQTHVLRLVRKILSLSLLVAEILLWKYKSVQLF